MRHRATGTGEGRLLVTVSGSGSAMLGVIMRAKVRVTIMQRVSLIGIRAAVVTYKEAQGCGPV